MYVKIVAFAGGKAFGVFYDVCCERLAWVAYCPGHEPARSRVYFALSTGTSGMSIAAPEWIWRAAALWDSVALGDIAESSEIVADFQTAIRSRLTFSALMSSGGVLVRDGLAVDATGSALDAADYIDSGAVCPEHDGIPLAESVRRMLPVADVGDGLVVEDVGDGLALVLRGREVWRMLASSGRVTFCGVPCGCLPVESRTPAGVLAVARAAGREVSIVASRVGWAYRGLGVCVVHVPDSGSIACVGGGEAVGSMVNWTPNAPDFVAARGGAIGCAAAIIQRYGTAPVNDYRSRDYGVTWPNTSLPIGAALANRDMAGLLTFFALHTPRALCGGCGCAIESGEWCSDCAATFDRASQGRPVEVEITAADRRDGRTRFTGTVGVELESVVSSPEPVRGYGAEHWRSVGGWGWCGDASITHEGRSRGQRRTANSRRIGVEFVSPVCASVAQLAARMRLFQAARRSHAADGGASWANKSCGYHIHLGLDSFGAGRWTMLRRLLTCWRRWEGECRWLVPASRWGGTYSRPMWSGVFAFAPESLTHVVSESTAAMWWYRAGDIASATLPDGSLAPESVSGPGRIAASYIDHATRRRGQKYDESRYYAVNLHSVFFRGTLEIRLHSGTVESAKVMRWARLWGDVLAYCYDTRRDIDLDTAGAFLDRAPARDRAAWLGRAESLHGVDAVAALQGVGV